MTHFYFNVSDLVHSADCGPADHRWEDVSREVASGVAALDELKLKKVFMLSVPNPRLHKIARLSGAKHLLRCHYRTQLHSGLDCPSLALHNCSLLRRFKLCFAIFSPGQNGRVNQFPKRRPKRCDSQFFEFLKTVKSLCGLKALKSSEKEFWFWKENFYLKNVNS